MSASQKAGRLQAIGLRIAAVVVVLSFVGDRSLIDHLDSWNLAGKVVSVALFFLQPVFAVWIVYKVPPVRRYVGPLLGLIAAAAAINFCFFLWAEPAKAWYYVTLATLSGIGFYVLRASREGTEINANAPGR